jgi:hypothetical protein
MSSSARWFQEVIYIKAKGNIPNTENVVTISLRAVRIVITLIAFIKYVIVIIFVNSL